jgi:hypothetical protein
MTTVELFVLGSESLNAGLFLGFSGLGEMLAEEPGQLSLCRDMMCPIE